MVRGWLWRKPLVAPVRTCSSTIWCAARDLTTPTTTEWSHPCVSAKTPVSMASFASTSARNTAVSMAPPSALHDSHESVFPTNRDVTSIPRRGIPLFFTQGPRRAVHDSRRSRFRIGLLFGFEPVSRTVGTSQRSTFPFASEGIGGGDPGRSGSNRWRKGRRGSTWTAEVW